MEPLIIYEAQSTPKVILDKASGKFEIVGNSLPEDVLAFYTPVLNWIKEYVENPNPSTHLNIRLTYFNSASSKVILEILNILESIIDKGNVVEANWYYLEIDEDMLATGQEFSELLKIPFNFYSYMQE
jgi:hypothetical protein